MDYLGLAGSPKMRIGILLVGLLVLLSACESDDLILSETEIKKRCVDSYLERFDVTIIDGPKLDEFFEHIPSPDNFFSTVKVGTTEASAILYLAPVLPSADQIKRVSNEEFEGLSEAYAQFARDGTEIDLSLKETKTFELFQEVHREAMGQLEKSKGNINNKLCVLDYRLPGGREQGKKNAIVSVDEGCYLESPEGARFAAPDEKEFYSQVFRDRLNADFDSIDLRVAPLWRANWASQKGGACLLYSFSRRIEEEAL